MQSLPEDLMLVVSPLCLRICEAGKVAACGLVDSRFPSLKAHDYTWAQIKVTGCLAPDPTDMDNLFVTVSVGGQQVVMQFETDCWQTVITACETSQVSFVVAGRSITSPKIRFSRTLFHKTQLSSRKLQHGVEVGAEADIVAAAKDSGPEDKLIENWLVNANTNLGTYTEAFVEYGFEDTSLLLKADDVELEEAFEALDVKKYHRKLIVQAKEDLQSTLGVEEFVTEQVEETVPIVTWLTTVNAILGKYANSFADYGFEHSHMILEAQRDLDEACNDLKVKIFHQKLIVKEVQALRNIIPEKSQGGFGEGAVPPETPIHAWMANSNAYLGDYADAFVDYGLEDISLLLKADEEDLNEAMKELKVKKYYRNVLAQAHSKLRSELPAGIQSNACEIQKPHQMSISAWLEKANGNLVHYIDPLKDYGVEDTGLLLQAEKTDLEQAFVELKVKMFHRKVITRAIDELLEVMDIEIRSDPSSNRQYFYHRGMGESKWSREEMVKMMDEDDDEDDDQDPHRMPITDCLAKADRNLPMYTDAFVQYGFEDTSLLLTADNAELEEAFSELEVKVYHRKVISRKLEQLRGAYAWNEIEEKTDPESGRAYFFHAAKGETAWSREELEDSDDDEKSRLQKPVGAWLMKANMNLRSYNAGFVEYGFEDSSLLLKANPDDLHDLFIELEVKTYHRKLIVKEIEVLRDLEAVVAKMPKLPSATSDNLHAQHRMPITQWLVSTHPLLGNYAHAFAEYGFEDTSMILDADQAGLQEACVELKVKEFHIQLIDRAAEALRDAPHPPSRPKAKLSKEKMPIADWLVRAHPNLGGYASAFAAYGFEDTTMLSNADHNDLNEALEDANVKKYHRKVSVRAFEELRVVAWEGRGVPPPPPPPAPAPAPQVVHAPPSPIVQKPDSPPVAVARTPSPRPVSPMSPKPIEPLAPDEAIRFLL
jgi:hypothetical protein